MGKLVDIGRGGLAFQFLPRPGQKKDATELDILISDNGFYLSMIPCNIIYEIEQHTIYSLKNRRLGVEFGGLTQEQATLLERYLKDYTIDRVKATGPQHLEIVKYLRAQ